MKTKDMTSGHPFKILLFFAIPMILSVTLQQLYNLADNFIAGHFITNLNSFEAVGYCLSRNGRIFRYCGWLWCWSWSRGSEILWSKGF